MATMKETTEVDPLEVQVGGDADIPGIAQTITTDDIQAILTAPDPVDERREQLKMLLTELQARASADRGHEFEGLIEEVQAAIDQLDAPAGDAGDPAAFAMSEGRSDVLPPDEIGEEGEDQ